MQIRFEVNGEVQLSRNLRIAAVDLKNMQEFYRDAINIMHDRSNRIFASKGQNVEKGPKWKSLKGRTERSREKRWGYYKNTPNNPSILRWTGRLQEDVTKKVTSKGGILKYNALYAVYHQEGEGKLPKRVIIDLDNQTNRNIIKALQSKINRDVKIFGKQK